MIKVVALHCTMDIPTTTLDKDIWWDCDQGINADVGANNQDNIESNQDMNDPFFDFFDTIDMISVSPSIFDNFEVEPTSCHDESSVTSSTPAARALDEYGYSEPVADERTSTPIDVLEETISKMEDYNALLVGSSNSGGGKDIVNKQRVINDRLEDVFTMANQDDIDLMLAKQFNKLSMEEQTTGRKDVHGISDVTIGYDNDAGAANDNRRRQHHRPMKSAERPSMLVTEMEREKIREFMLLLTTTKITSNGYDIAMSLNSGYVQDPSFLLMFLRGEQYEIPKATRRLMHHFDVKLDLFGKEL